MPIIIYVMLFTIFTVVHVNAAADPEHPGEQIDAIFSPVNNTDTPGCAVGVIRNGVYIHKAGYGMANLELGVPLSPDSIFRIGSISKQFTAMAILLMADDGLIDLDEGINTYLPELVDYGKNVSVRSMLGHVSGIPDYSAVLAGGSNIEGVAKEYQLRSVAGGPYRMGNKDYLSNSEFYDVVKKFSLDHAPMTRFDYSNTNYFLFSMLVEEKTGQTLREFSQRRIFGPLGMKNTFYHDDMVEIIKNRATGYKPKEGGGFVIDMTNLFIVGDGGVHTSINEFIHWDRHFYEPKLGKPPSSLIKILNTPNSRFKNREGALYANGQIVGHRHGRITYSHSGSWLGFRSYYVRYPEEKFSVVTFCNDAGQEPKKYSEKIEDLYIGIKG